MSEIWQKAKGPVLKVGGVAVGSYVLYKSSGVIAYGIMGGIGFIATRRLWQALKHKRREWSGTDHARQSGGLSEEIREEKRGVLYFIGEMLRQAAEMNKMAWDQAKILCLDLLRNDHFVVEKLGDESFDLLLDEKMTPFTNVAHIGAQEVTQLESGIFLAISFAIKTEKSEKIGLGVLEYAELQVEGEDSPVITVVGLNVSFPGEDGIYNVLTGEQISGYRTNYYKKSKKKPEGWTLESNSSPIDLDGSVNSTGTGTGSGSRKAARKKQDSVVIDADFVEIETVDEKQNKK